MFTLIQNHPDQEDWDQDRKGIVPDFARCRSAQHVIGHRFQHSSNQDPKQILKPDQDIKQRDHASVFDQADHIQNRDDQLRQAP